MTPNEWRANEWRDRTIQVFRDLDSTELPDAAYQCAVYAANESQPLHEAALDVFAALAGIDALVAANRRLAIERDDLRLQRDELLSAVKAWNSADWKRGRGHSATTKLLDALMYCRDWTPAERARDAEERAGMRAAADETALRHGG